MTYCGTCRCPIEPSDDPRVGWKHVCSDRHLHRVEAAISAKQAGR